MWKSIAKALICFAIVSQTYAQDAGSRSYLSLELPVSAHAAALGGDNISTIEDNFALTLHNPALLSSVSPNTLSLGYMNYMADVQALHAGYANIAGERSTYGIAATMMDYGTFSRRDEYNHDLGTFNAKDIAISGMYAYNLTDYWSGGVAGKVVYRTYDSWSSIALAADLALNYYNADRNLSISIAARNLGGEVSHFDDRTERLPINLMAGITKKLAHAPFSLNATLTNLQDTKLPVFQHLILGVDVNFTKSFYAAAGYNFRRAEDMSINDSSGGAGWTFGAGLKMRKIKLNASYARYHVSGGCILMDIAYTL